ncbi:MAG: monooxygenase FAD-binding [Chthonomonadaceae bacterium]|nr:monooxygenase FAD-binding [Chthonomonadaceae bacterium]
MNDAEVLIVGAGPTGLALALFLTHSGVKPRITEKNSGPGQESRAMVVQARTLEFYRQLGFAEDVVNRGIKMETAHFRKDSHEVTEIHFGDFGAGLSPYPFVLSFPQDDHERLLGEQLKAVGVDVEWGTELVDFANEGDRIRATLQTNGAQTECIVAYLCGCDGAHSTVRQGLGMGFPGGTYDQKFYVTDVEAEGVAAVKDGFSAWVGTHELCLVFPIRSTGMHRLIGTVPDELTDRVDLTFEDIRPFVAKLVGLNVSKVNWFSSYHVHHRVADHFRAGCAFLLGDAGHVHSPAGGQGMNTGIGDAVNLSWKLAAALQGRADSSILDTYEAERIAFARSLVATTDRIFQLMVGRGLSGQLFREALLPHMAPFLFGFSGVRSAAFRLLSQTRINYLESPLSEGSAGEVHGGDRLPWVVSGDGSDNFAPLRSLDWQVHVYGDAGQALRDAARNGHLALHRFNWTDSMRDAGLKRNALYLVRPDGYVALADVGQEVEKLRTYLTGFKILPRLDATA